MTNREILRAPKEILGGVDRQRQFSLKVEGTPLPCPVCTERVNVFDAANIDIDTFDFGKTKLDYHCPSCGAKLEQIVPLIAVANFWHWQIKQSWIQEVMKKAKAFDEQRQTDESPSSPEA